MWSPKNFWNNDHGFVWLLGIMLATVIMTQFSVGFMWAEMLFIRIGFFIFMVIAIGASLLSPTSKKVGNGVSLALLIFSFVLVEDDSPILLLIHSCIITAFMVFTLILLVRQIFGGRRMTLQKIGGGIAVYIIIGQIWTELYVTIFQLSPQSFRLTDGVILPEEALRHLSYFSFVTLTTIGYGDILAVGSTARALVILEGLVGQLFPAIFIAKLVSLQIAHSKE